MCGNSDIHGDITGTRVGTRPATRIDVDGNRASHQDRFGACRHGQEKPLRHDPRRLSPGFLVVHSGSAGAVAANAKRNAGGDGALQTPLPDMDQGL